MAYLTPAQGPSLPQLPLGPLTGFMTGMQLDAANQMNQRMLRDDDLQYLINDIRRQSDASNLDVTKAKNQNDVLGQAIIAQQYGSGAKQAQADAAVAADTSGNQAKAVEAQDAIKQSLAVPTVQMADFIKQNGGQLDPTNQAHLDAWKQYSDVLRLHGVKAPDFPDPQQQAALLQKGASYINSVPYQQQLGAIKAQGGVQETLHAMDNASHESVAGTQAKAHVQGTQITADANVQRTQLQLQASKSMELSIISTIQEFARQGGIPESFVPVLRQQAQRMIEIRPDIVLARTMAQTSPNPVAAQKAVDNQVVDAADAWLRQNGAFTKAEKAAGGGNVPSPANAPSGLKEGAGQAGDEPRRLTIPAGQSIPSDLRPGDYVNGHKYKGGSVNSKDSWEQ